MLLVAASTAQTPPPHPLYTDLDLTHVPEITHASSVEWVLRATDVHTHVVRQYQIRLVAENPDATASTKLANRVESTDSFVMDRKPHGFLVLSTLCTVDTLHGDGLDNMPACVGRLRRGKWAYYQHSSMNKLLQTIRGMDVSYFNKRHSPLNTTGLRSEDAIRHMLPFLTRV